MSTKKKLVKSTAIISSGIMTSRILGFIRDILIANFFGTKMFAQAFVIAFTIPNALRQLVAEGAVNTVMVPVLTEYYTTRSKNEFLRFANVLFNLFLIALLFITIGGILATPFLIKVIAPGFIINPEKLSLTIELTKILFPYILLVGLTAYCIGVLHTLNRFAAPAFGSVVLNATIIGGLLIFYPNVNILHLVFAVLIGGVLQLLLQVFPLLKIGRFFDIRAGLSHKGAGKVGSLFLPRIIGAGVYQINIVVDRMLASLQLIAGQGAIAALYYGNRLFQFPLALFAIAIATAALPTMSSLAAEKNIGKLKEIVSFSIRNMFFLSVPASVGLLLLSKPIIKVIFERGEFTSYATEITSSVLFFYCIGLVAYGGIKILVTAFYAMQDTLTPVKIAFFCLLINILFNVILMVPLKAGGLALATSISGFVNFVSLFIMLRRRIGCFGERKILNSLLKILLASLIMGGVAYSLMTAVTWGGGVKDAVNLILIILLSIAVYLGLARILRIKEMEVLVSWIRNI